MTGFTLASMTVQECLNEDSIKILFQSMASGLLLNTVSIMKYSTERIKYVKTH
jgi:hypothetical protein